MDTEVEDMRRKLFGDDKNEFLMRVVFENIQRRFKYGATGYSDPITRQTGRTTQRILEGLAQYKNDPNVTVVYFVAHKTSTAEMMKKKFLEYADLLGIEIRADTWTLTRSNGHSNDNFPAIHIYDHAMP